MPGLIDSDTGLSYGKGLHFESGIGGAGFINPSLGTETGNIVFAGSGGLTASAGLRLLASAVFAGSGLFVESAIRDAAVPFNGAGSLSAATTATLATSAALAGAGSLSATTNVALRTLTTFSGAGSLSAEAVKGFVDQLSLIFTRVSSQYLTATGKTNINQQKFTLSLWFKRASSGSLMVLYYAGDHAASFFMIDFSTFNNLQVSATASGFVAISKITSASYTDSLWHSLVVGVDTTQATADNRVRVYVDGTEITTWTTSINPAQNSNLDNNFVQSYGVGSQFVAVTGFTRFFDGNLDDIYYVDGQQLDPTYFITGTPGVPTTYSGTYTGVFDFALLFEDKTSTATLGSDSSGEGNNWTLVNMTTANSSTDHPV